MKKKLLLSLTLLLLSTGCSHRYRHSADTDLEKIAHTAKKRTDYYLPWSKIIPSTEHDIAHGVSMDKSVQLALNSDPGLHSHLEQMGIAKTDLIQAGFLTNPRLDTVFQLPRRAGDRSCIDVDATFKVSDLWQIPLRKKIAESELEITSIATLELTLTIIEATKIFYLQTLYEEAQLQTTKKILEHIMLLRDKIYQRKLAGYASDYDTNFADALVGQWQSNTLMQQIVLDDAYTALRKAIGEPINKEPILLLEKLKIKYGNLADPEKYIEYAKNNKPEALIAQMKIIKAKHEQSLEKRKVFDDVEVGLSFTRDLGGNKIIGPAIGLSLPIFDSNQAQIARAHYEEKKAAQALEDVVTTIKESVHRLHNTISGHLKQITLYESVILPATQKALAYNQTYADSMQIDSITLIKSHVDLYTKELELNRHYFELWKTIATLEKTIGGKLPQ